MDNINLIRVGFNVEDFRLTDTAGDSGSPIEKSDKFYSCLLFANADDSSAKLINTLALGAPRTKSDLGVILSVILPEKTVSAGKFKDAHTIKARLYCDSDLRAGKMFSVIDSSIAKPTFHTVAFVINDKGTVLYRQASENGEFDTDKFNQTIRNLI